MLNAATPVHGDEHRAKPINLKDGASPNLLAETSSDVCLADTGRPSQQKQLCSQVEGLWMVYVDDGQPPEASSLWSNNWTFIEPVNGVNLSGPVGIVRPKANILRSVHPQARLETSPIPTKAT